MPGGLAVALGAGASLGVAASAAKANARIVNTRTPTDEMFLPELNLPGRLATKPENGKEKALYPKNAPKPRNAPVLWHEAWKCIFPFDETRDGEDLRVRALGRYGDFAACVSRPFW